MKLIHDSAPFILHLLLLAELFVRTSSRPTHSSSICGFLGSMIPQVDRIMMLSKNLHGLSDDELLNLAAVDNRLDDLPHIQQTAAHFTSRKVNESLSQLHVYTQSFKLHIDWLITAQFNFSLPTQPAEGASAHLLQLSTLIHTSLHQMHETSTQAPPPSLPVAASTFDVLQFSVEISERLHVFCNWSRRLLRHLQKLSRCPRR
ncbi:interleukin 11 type b [Solea senegalensis]|uniref:Interleukin 11 type b n=1 Tax=Solea senegalensis TaxID=28829 RepID=A0AAV6PAZ9_SOLSE|nr:uncharacterized protein LOC122762090 isoform X1 [Solea senegalensis]KAG7453929.1 interleukin 11 type b [Solea senegalensis]